LSAQFLSGGDNQPPQRESNLDISSKGFGGYRQCSAGDSLLVTLQLTQGVQARETSHHSVLGYSQTERVQTHQQVSLAHTGARVETWRTAELQTARFPPFFLASRYRWEAIWSR